MRVYATGRKVYVVQVRWPTWRIGVKRHVMGVDYKSREVLLDNLIGWARNDAGRLKCSAKFVGELNEINSL